jgi:hypothetical protein
MRGFENFEMITSIKFTTFVLLLLNSNLTAFNEIAQLSVLTQS